MAQVIDFREIQTARRLRRSRLERQHLEEAVELLRINLAAAAIKLRESAPHEEEELLQRVERLTELLRYGLRILGRGASPDDPFSRDEDEPVEPL